MQRMNFSKGIDKGTIIIIIINIYQKQPSALQRPNLNLTNIGVGKTAETVKILFVFLQFGLSLYCLLSRVSC